jgi:hypothetical protein
MRSGNFNVENALGTHGIYGFSKGVSANENSKKWSAFFLHQKKKKKK